MLTHLFQQSLQHGIVLSDWRLAFIIPIHKKGSKADPKKTTAQFHLTSVVCNSMEHILSSKIMHHLDHHHITLDIQFGFYFNHSCETQLLLTTDNFAKSIDHSLQIIDATILDFAKVFDKVSPYPQIRLYGIRGCLLNWFQLFLHKIVPRMLWIKVRIQLLVKSPQVCFKGPCWDQLFFSYT